jgi:hypothetical protein
LILPQSLEVKSIRKKHAHRVSRGVVAVRRVPEATPAKVDVDAQVRAALRHRTRVGTDLQTVRLNVVQSKRLRGRTEPKRAEVAVAQAHGLKARKPKGLKLKARKPKGRRAERIKAVAQEIRNPAQDRLSATPAQV